MHASVFDQDVHTVLGIVRRVQYLVILRLEFGRALFNISARDVKVVHCTSYSP